MEILLKRVEHNLAEHLTDVRGKANRVTSELDQDVSQLWVKVRTHQQAVIE